MITCYDITNFVISCYDIIDMWDEDDGDHDVTFVTRKLEKLLRELIKDELSHVTQDITCDVTYYITCYDIIVGVVISLVISVIMFYNGGRQRVRSRTKQYYSYNTRYHF